MMEERLRGAVEEANKEKALKEVAKAMAKEKGTAVEKAEERTKAAEKAQALAEQKMAEIVAKFEEMELQLAGAESLNLVKDK